MAWVRSQDRTFITEIQTVAYNLITHELRNYSDFFLDETGRTLGKWNTKKAALAELDRIEQWIANGAVGVFQIGEE